jgi:hypothetical protein
VLQLLGRAGRVGELADNLAVGDHDDAIAELGELLGV